MTKFKIVGAATVAGLLVAFCGAANATTMHHYRVHHRHMASRVANSFAYEPAQASVRFSAPSYSDAPSYNDASKFGGSTALPAE